MSGDLYQEIARLRREEIPAALATIVDTKGSTPGKLAQKMIVLADGRIIGTVGGGCLEADVIREARDVMETGRTKKLRFTLAGEEAERTGLACGGTLEVMVETLNETRVFVIGCGHVGQTVARLAAGVGFRVTVLDDRPDFASRERFPEVDEVHCAELGSLAETLRVGPRGIVISVTRGHNHDYEVLKWALTTSARYIGVIGSRSKRIQFFRKLEEEGVATDGLDRVHCPVGLEIGARTPEEIAVSVVAELIAVERLGALPR